VLTHAATGLFAASASFQTAIGPCGDFLNLRKAAVEKGILPSEHSLKSGIIMSRLDCERVHSLKIAVLYQSDTRSTCRKTAQGTGCLSGLQAAGHKLADRAICKMLGQSRAGTSK